MVKNHPAVRLTAHLTARLPDSLLPVVPMPQGGLALKAPVQKVMGCSLRSIAHQVAPQDILHRGALQDALHLAALQDALHLEALQDALHLEALQGVPHLEVPLHPEVLQSALHLIVLNMFQERVHEASQQLVVPVQAGNPHQAALETDAKLHLHIKVVQ